MVDAWTPKPMLLRLATLGQGEDGSVVVVVVLLVVVTVGVVVGCTVGLMP